MTTVRYRRAGNRTNLDRASRRSHRTFGDYAAAARSDFADPLASSLPNLRFLPT